MKPEDMRTIIQLGPKWEELLELLRVLLDGHTDHLKGDPANQKDIPPALRRECIDRCDAMKTPDDKERLSWEHFNTLRDDTLESWCLIFAVDAEDDDWDSRSRRWRRLPKSEMANKLAAMIRSQAESDSS